MLQTVIHYSLHYIFPAFIAYVLFQKNWKRVWLVLVCTMLVDLDHLLATPMFDPDRCSIGFHPLHSLTASAVYGFIILIPYKWIRVVGIGLLFHMVTDLIDCIWTFSDCEKCIETSIFYKLLS